MNTEITHNLETLVKTLQEDQEVQWNTVLDLLADYPGWLLIAERLRGQAGNYGSQFASGYVSPVRDNPFASEAYYLVSPDMRERLLTTFAPYAVLLDTEKLPGERAHLLQEMTGDSSEFCRECLENTSPVIVAAAQEVLTFCKAQESLLRSSAAPETSPSELLRVPQDSPGQNDATLLHPAESPASPEPEQTGWLMRLFRRRKTSL